MNIEAGGSIDSGDSNMIIGAANIGDGKSLDKNPDGSNFQVPSYPSKV